MSDKNYAKSENGLVHLVNPCTPEHTLCGDAFDIDSEQDDAEAVLAAWVPCRTGPVTCPQCARVIQECRRVIIRL